MHSEISGNSKTSENEYLNYPADELLQNAIKEQLAILSKDGGTGSQTTHSHSSSDSKPEDLKHKKKSSPKESTPRMLAKLGGSRKNTTSKPATFMENEFYQSEDYKKIINCFKALDGDTVQWPDDDIMESLFEKNIWGDLSTKFLPSLCKGVENISDPKKGPKEVIPSLRAGATLLAIFLKYAIKKPTATEFQEIVNRHQAVWMKCALNSPLFKDKIKSQILISNMDNLWTFMRADLLTDIDDLNVKRKPSALKPRPIVLESKESLDNPLSSKNEEDDDTTYNPKGHYDKNGIRQGNDQDKPQKSRQGDRPIEKPEFPVVDDLTVQEDQIVDKEIMQNSQKPTKCCVIF